MIWDSRTQIRVRVKNTIRPYGSQKWAFREQSGWDAGGFNWWWNCNPRQPSVQLRHVLGLLTLFGFSPNLPHRQFNPSLLTWSLPGLTLPCRASRFCEKHFYSSSFGDNLTDYTRILRRVNPGFVLARWFWCGNVQGIWSGFLPWQSNVQRWGLK